MATNITPFRSRAETARLSPRSSGGPARCNSRDAVCRASDQGRSLDPRGRHVALRILERAHVGEPISRRPRSAKPSMAATAGSKLNARTTSRGGTSTLRRCPIRRRRSYMTWPADFVAAVAARPTASRLRHCFNWRSAPSERRRLESCHLYSTTAYQTAIAAVRVMNRYARRAMSERLLRRTRHRSGRACPTTRDSHAGRGQRGHVGCVRHLNLSGG